MKKSKEVIRNRIERGARVTRYIVYRETLVDFRENFWAFTGSFAGIGIISWVQHFFLPYQDNFFLIGSFGASSVLVYGVIQSPLAQPRNLIGGHVLSALCGVSVNMCLPDVTWLAAPLSVSSAIVVMQITKTLHPPGGATALIAVIGSAKIKSLGYMYVIAPVLAGALVLLVTALVFNNLTPNRKYPTRDGYTRRIKFRITRALKELRN